MSCCRDNVVTPSSCVSSCAAKDRDDVEVEEEEGDEEEEDEGGAVNVETESYVHLRKQMVRKHEYKMDNVLQENGKLCRDFRRKPVRHHLLLKRLVWVCSLGGCRWTCSVSLLTHSTMFSIKMSSLGPNTFR